MIETFAIASAVLGFGLLGIAVQLRRSSLSKLQVRAGDWARGIFGKKCVANGKERALRVLEEALEFAQASGVPRGQSVDLISQVYNKLGGDQRQEVAGVIVASLVAAEGLGVDLASAVRAELARIEALTPEVVRARNAVRVRDGDPYPYSGS